MYVDMSHHIALYQQNIEIETFSPFMKLCDDLQNHIAQYEQYAGI